jgi:hypothetical protein
MPGTASRSNGKKGGRPRGSKSEKTLTKELGREIVRQAVLANIKPLLDAQMANAMGLKYLIVRDKRSGKFIRVPEIRAKALKDDEEVVEVWEKDPSVPAFTDLFNRALDKPKEQEQTINLDVSLNVVDILKRRFKVAA